MRVSKQKNRSAHGTETDTRKFFRYIVLTLYGLAVAFFLFSSAGTSFSDHLWLLWAGFVLCLCSMTSVWASCYQGHAAIPSVALTLSTLGYWWLLTDVPYHPFRDESEICWAVVVIVQTLATAGGVSALDSFSKTSRRKFRVDEVSGAVRRRFTFRIETTIWWTTCSAIALFAVRYLVQVNGWATNPPARSAVVLAIAAGLVGAVFAVIWLAVFRGAIWTNVIQRSLIALPAFTIFVMAFHIAVVGFQNVNTADLTPAALLFGSQCSFVALTMIATLNHTRR